MINILFGWRTARVAAVFLILTVCLLPQNVYSETIDEIRDKLDAKRKDLKSTEEKIQKLRADIQVKKSQAKTLQDQIELLDANINELSAQLTRTQQEIEEKDLEITEVKSEIEEREAEMRIQKGRLAAFIRQMHDIEQESTVTIFLKYQTFSDAIQEAATFEELQHRGQETLAEIKKLRDELKSKHENLADIKRTLEELRERQSSEQQILASQRNSKDRILDLTNSQEAKYQDLLKEAQATHLAAQSEISRLDQIYRERLSEENLASVGSFSWPIPRTFGISCGFHCPNYPYAYLIGPHSGVDIPANVGTPIAAPADGIVARVHDSGGAGYSYIMLVHKENFSTVFGHVSGFAVREGQVVSRGTIIGFTGGAPGQHGAGLSTGPHLHWEVRVTGSPQDPLKYT